jgi:cell surface protein SprA
MYNWQVAPQSTGTTNWGNTIRNSNNIQASGQLNFNTLYNRSDYLKNLNRKYSSKTKKNKEQKRTVRFNENDIELKKGQAYIINHKLKTKDIRVRVFDSNGRTARGKTTPINESKAEFIPEADYSDARLMVTGTIIDKTTVLGTITDYTVMMLTGVKNVSVNYSETNGTILPGYLQKTELLGSSNGLSAPGFAFISGWQDRYFAEKAGEKGWITTDTINQAYVMTNKEDFTFKSTIEPIKGLRIDLTANRRYSNNIDEYYRYTNDEFIANNLRESGNFSMTYNIFSTAFDDIKKEAPYNSDAYDKFLENIETMKGRLIRERNQIDTDYDPINDGTGYNTNSQEVLIPAFLSAYSGKDANTFSTDLFPEILKIHPNWRITYDGLSKIGFIQKYIRSFDITHGYRSTYNIGSYVTNNGYEEKDGISTVRDELYINYLSKYQINSVTLQESFSPLIGLNITWKNSLSTRIERKKSRTLNLSLTNIQLIENYTKEFVIGLGYRFDKMDLILGSKSGQKKMSSDLNLRADLSIRDNISIIRKIEDEINQLTSGQKITTLKFTADYVLSDRFNMQLFYDKAINTPYISSTYPTTNSNFGISFRFSLAQ